MHSTVWYFWGTEYGRGIQDESGDKEIAETLAVRIRCLEEGLIPCKYY